MSQISWFNSAKFVYQIHTLCLFDYLFLFLISISIEIYILWKVLLSLFSCVVWITTSLLFYVWQRMESFISYAHDIWAAAKSNRINSFQLNANTIEKTNSQACDCCIRSVFSCGQTKNLFSSFIKHIRLVNIWFGFWLCAAVSQAIYIFLLVYVLYTLNSCHCLPHWFFMFIYWSGMCLPKPIEKFLNVAYICV